MVNDKLFVEVHERIIQDTLDNVQRSNARNESFVPHVDVMGLQQFMRGFSREMQEATIAKVDQIVDSMGDMSNQPKLTSTDVLRKWLFRRLGHWPVRRSFPTGKALEQYLQPDIGTPLARGLPIISLGCGITWFDDPEVISRFGWTEEFVDGALRRPNNRTGQKFSETGRHSSLGPHKQAPDIWMRYGAYGPSTATLYGKVVRPKFVDGDFAGPKNVDGAIQLCLISDSELRRFVGGTRPGQSQGYGNVSKLWLDHTAKVVSDAKKRHESDQLRLAQSKERERFMKATKIGESGETTYPTWANTDYKRKEYDILAGITLNVLRQKMKAAGLNSTGLKKSEVIRELITQGAI